jgi:hypothetical protein
MNYFVNNEFMDTTASTHLRTTRGALIASDASQVREGEETWMPDTSMPESDIHHGGCGCGAVRYRTQGQPVRTGVCHCRYCQTRTGSAFGVSVYFQNAKVVKVSGELKDYTFETESGRSFTTRFCTSCGTTVFWSLAMSPDLTGVAGGTFDPPTFWYPISREIFTRSAAPFVHTDLPEKHETTASYAPVRQDTENLRGGGRG